MHVVADLVVAVAAAVVAAVIAVTLITYSTQIVSYGSSVAYTFEEKMSIRFKIVMCYVGADYAVILVKNVGMRSLSSDLVERLDVFFGKPGEVKYVPYVKRTTTTPYWTYAILNDYTDPGSWNVGETMNVTVVWGSTLSSGDYVARVVAHTGFSDGCYTSK